jgi:hypothetical protein
MFFINDYTRISWVYFLKENSEALQFWEEKMENNSLQMNSMIIVITTELRGK